MQRKILSVVLILVIGWSFTAGCQSKATETPVPTSPPEPTDAATATTVPTTPAPPPTDAPPSTETPESGLPPTPTMLPAPSQTVKQGSAGLPWWNDRVFYEVFVRSFYDSDGDGVGDLPGLISKLDYLNDGDPNTDSDLGITGIWLMPVAESPNYHGYDVVDYYTIERDYGSNEDFKALIAAAHERGIAVIIDLVMNHTSSQHPWFLEARTPGSEYDDWYVWSDEALAYPGPWGQKVWHPAGGRYFYGVFWDGMPDLNYRNGAVTETMYDVIRFWLEDMGVDGFRLDAIKHLIEDDEMQEHTPETHAWLQGFYRYVHNLSPDAMTVGEVWSETFIVVKYIGDEVDMAFEFSLSEAILDSVRQQNYRPMHRALKTILESYPAGQYATFLTNHDQNRVMHELREDVGAAKTAAALLLTSPGVPFLYYGEEIGMVGAKPDERIRTPMQWDDTPDSAGFSDGRPWEALAEGHEERNVSTQDSDPDSLLNHYRTLIRLRQEHPALRVGELLLVSSSARPIYACLRHTDDESLLVLINLSDEAITDYALSLEQSALSGEVSATLLVGQGQPAAPTLSETGGFDAYTPLENLPPRSASIIQLGP